MGTGVELFFIEHTAGWKQLTPFVLFVMSVFSLAWHALDRKSASVRVFQITMILLVVSGIAGAFFHYQFNAEFEIEGDAALQGMDLFWRAMSGAAPSLAPGTMVQLGLLGLVYTFRHPALNR
jgi:hypothetical protein